MKLNYVTKQGVYYDTISVLESLRDRGVKYALLSFRSVSRDRRDLVRGITFVNKTLVSNHGVVLTAKVIFCTVRKELAFFNYPDLLDLSKINNSKGYFVIDLQSLKDTPLVSPDNDLSSLVRELITSKTAFRLQEVK